MNHFSNKLAYSFCLLFFMLSTLSFAQGKVKDTTRTWDLVKYDFNASLRSIGNSFTQPIRWKKKDFVTFAGIAAGTAILYSVDDNTASYFTQQEEDIPIGIREFGRYFGNPQNNYAISAGIYTIGLFTKNEKMRKTGVLLIASGFTVGFIQSATKTIIGRARPGSGYNKNYFKPLSKEGAFHSLPSGHAALVATTTHAIAKQFDSLGIKILVYSIGAITPISRLWSTDHWLTDIVLGSVLGIVVVDGIDNFLFKENLYSYPEKKKKVSWNLKVGVGQLGVVGTF